KNPNNGGSTTTTPPTTGGGGTTTSNPSSGSDGSNNMTPSEPTNSKKAVEAYVKTLMPDSFKLVNSSNAEITKDSIKASEVTKENIKLKENNPATEGWTLGVELVSNSDSTNPENDSVKFKIKFTKESDEVTSNEITISGFKTLQTAVAKALLKEMTVKDSNGQDVKKNLLDLGSAGFKTLVDLNKQGVVRTTTGGTGEAAVQPATRASIVEMTGTPEAQPQPELVQDKTSGLNDKFKTLIHGESSEYKTKLDKIKETYPDFNPDNLYLSGQAKLVNLWKANDWHGNYYLISKDGNDNKLSIKYKGKSWSIVLTDGLFIQDLLPDSVKILVSKTPTNTYASDEEFNNQENSTPYKQLVSSESNSKYSLDGDVLKVKPDKIVNENPKVASVIVNPIKIPYVDPSKANEILFKAKYIFDGTGMFNGDVFGTKLLFKKIHNWDYGNNDTNPVGSNKIASIWFGTNYIPGTTIANVDIDSVKRKDSNFNTWQNWGDYFWKGQNNDIGFVDSISGEDNSISGAGVSQLIQKEGEKSIIANGKTLKDLQYNIIANRATNYIIFPRIAYKSGMDENAYSYLWDSSITLLHIQAPTQS
ncbi:lipoprotein 17-related variable surface protein, partial [Mycoplasma bradburyae]|uniref:lipoprotein 17-related variable surface protein n=1 Tax=Mycoplasma bradburyae TaxID=2963128 RepID=UPI0023426369